MSRRQTEVSEDIGPGRASSPRLDDGREELIDEGEKTLIHALSNCVLLHTVDRLDHAAESGSV